MADPNEIFVSNDTLPMFTGEISSAISFYVGEDQTTVMTLDKDGMTYKGVLIEDAGEAHKAFMEVMQMMSVAYG